MTTFVIECWNPKLHRYVFGWAGQGIDLALKTFNKPYYVQHTRQLREIRNVISKKAKKGKRG